MDSQSERELQILEYLERNPDTTQADLATRLGVAVGSVNWYLKRLINRGYVKVRQMQRRRLRYLVTPQGLAEKLAAAPGEAAQVAGEIIKGLKDGGLCDGVHLMAGARDGQAAEAMLAALKAAGL